jgi:formate C-acetyltransferase
VDDCIARGQDICSGGARYNLTGMIVAGVPNAVNALAAIHHCVFGHGAVPFEEVLEALSTDFADAEWLRRQLVDAPKWGNDRPDVDRIARRVSDALYNRMQPCRNARGGRWQLALYSFVANFDLGQVVGASADGRRAGTPLTRNLNPSPGTDRRGPTAVLRSLGALDFTQFPNGGTLDLRFDPGPLLTVPGRRLFAAFLKSFVNLGVMQMQVSMADTESLVDARLHPERWPNLMVKVAGYSARFVDLPPEEQEQIIGRNAQRLG